MSTTNFPAARPILDATGKAVLPITHADNVIDGEAAQNAGVDFAAVLTGNNVREDFFHLPHVKIMNTLAELP